MQKIEHIGIAVKNLEESEKIFSALLNSTSYKREFVASENVNTSFFRNGPNKIELLESTVKGGVIEKYIEKYGEGIHHIAFSVLDIYAEIDRLKKEGFKILNEIPKKGADNKLVCFVHPKTAGGVLIELCQDLNIN